MNTIIAHGSDTDFNTLPEIEQKEQIASWYKGTTHPIEDINLIKEIKLINNQTLCFWYRNELRNCPIGKRDIREGIVFDEIENFGVIRLVMRITNLAQLCIELDTETEQNLASL